MAADKYGGLELPMPQPEFGGKAPDKALDAISAYLQAVLPALIGAAWASVCPGEELVKTVFTVKPDDALINPAQLPGLFLWRGPSRSTREGEDYLINRTQVSCLWLIWWDSPLKREKVLPFQGAITLAAHAALAKGRHPAWIVPGDDPSDATGVSYRGSVLLMQAGLFAPLDELTTNEIDVVLQPNREAEPVKYKALQLTFQIAERMFRDPAGWASATRTADPQNATPSHPQAAALEMLLTQGGNELEQLKPPPTPPEP